MEDVNCNKYSREKFKVPASRSETRDRVGFKNEFLCGWH